MKDALVLSLFLVFALVDGFPGKWEKRRPGAGKREQDFDKGWQFEDWRVKDRPWDKKPGKWGDQEGVPVVRWCVTNPCEMKKCKRMVTEFNYMVTPRMQWSCVMASCKESCMEEIQRGNADIMTAEGDEIYTAGKIHDLIPIMSQREDHQDIPDYKAKFERFEEQDGTLKQYSIVLVKKTNPDVNNFRDMNQRKSCHSGVDAKATFKSPVCSLINQGVVPRVGNVYECAGEFFKESCVPGVQHDKYNPNMTNPESLCKLCKGPEDDDFCETLSDKEPYYGFRGALKCLRDGAGDVAFFHTHDVMMNYDVLSKEFDIVCKKQRLSLDWEKVTRTDCHLTEEHPQVLMVHAKKPKDWIKLCTSALTDASTRFSSPDSVNAFGLFDSSPYCAKINGDDSDSEQEDDRERDWFKWDKNFIKNKDLIFKDHSGYLETIPEDQRTYRDFLGADTVSVWKKCEQLEPKPRAFICVVGDEQMKKCQDMVNKFQTITDVKKISWGCVEASCKQDCVEMVATNQADLVDLNATEIFLAGMDFNLAPFIAENYKNKDPKTESITIGVMLKDNSDLPEDMRGWKMCNAGVHKINGFLHPMGWLMANGTIPRSTTPLKSIGHHFGESCVPGINTVDLTQHPLLSRTLSWRSMLKDKIIRWEDWYSTPLWRKWQDKENGNSDDYIAIHDIQDFESPEFRMMLQKMYSQNSRIRLTPEIREILEKASKDFSWDNYDGLEDFYGVKMPEWRIISWVWQKPEDWTEEQWRFYQMWAERTWDQNEDWASYIEKWTTGDWDTFKKWMDKEYQEYSKDHMRLHQDIFIRLSILCSRYYWLLDEWKNLQWDNVDMKHCRERMCDACAGQGDEKCSMDSIIEDYYGYDGALQCLKQGDGDVAFIDAYTFDDAIINNGYNKNDFVLLCPDGKTVQYTGADSYEECNFGRVPSHALVTCNMHDGIWRWKVTKALLEAQKVLTPQLFKDSIFSTNVESLTPIPFVNQTYQVWLGPMFLRAMEGLMQPPVREKESEYAMNDCEGEECDGDEEDRPACDECPEDDTMCMENCWSEESSEKVTKRPKHTDKPRPYGRRIPKRTGDRHHGRPERKRMPHKMPKKMMRKMRENMLWKPKGRQMRQMMGKKHMEFGMMGPMKHQGMRPMGPPPMRPPMMGTWFGKGPMKHGMKPMMRGKVYPEKFAGPMKYGMRPMMSYGTDKKHMMHPKVIEMTQWQRFPRPMMMKHAMMGQDPMMNERMRGHKMSNHHMETGPIMHSRRCIRGEFYTNVIFARDGTCNSIIHDLSCLGEKKIIRMKAGRVGKTLISVPMCPRPTIIKKTTAQFTCDNGASFMKPVLLPVKCSYVPCNPGFWLPDWSKDQYWQGDNSYSGDHWGNKDWWKLDQRDSNGNWFLAARDQNRVAKTKTWRNGGLKWLGQEWRKQ